MTFCREELSNEIHELFWAIRKRSEFSNNEGRLTSFDDSNGIIYYNP